MIVENLEDWNRWNNRRALLERKDWLMLFDLICSMERKVLGILFGINYIYVHHPSFKWLKHSAELMEKKPEQLYERLSDILTGKADESIQKLEDLIQDVIQLVEVHFPDINVKEYKRRAELVRPEQENKIK
jgi:hypothetical protein